MTDDELSKEKRNWVAIGTVTKRGVRFYFDNLTRAEVEQAICDHKFFDDCEERVTEISDWTIDTKTLEPNDDG